MRRYIPDFWRASRRYEICDGHCTGVAAKFINNRQIHARALIYTYTRESARAHTTRRLWEMDSQKKKPAHARQSAD